ncbi:MAG TPA: hypothetical protein VNU46_04490 [Gemmatimonadaceae bacterium]|jgi:hypothetical protein|nr:hypothetical protein [Gemmatimonadaceae bacterium]
MHTFPLWMSSAAVAISLAVTPMAHAQITMALDGGAQTTGYGTGLRQVGPYGGGALGFVIDGSVTKEHAVLFPMNLEIRGNTTTHAWNMQMQADMLIRSGNVTIGGGGVLAVPYGGTVRNGLGSGQDVQLDDIEMFGLSGTLKLNFGPQGRAFIQGRGTVFPAGMATRFIDGCNLPGDLADQPDAGSTEQDCEQVQQEHDPAFTGATDFRLSLGYTLLHGDGPIVIRLQGVQQQLNYKQEKDNSLGAYNRTSQSVTLGVVWILI